MEGRFPLFASMFVNYEAWTSIWDTNMVWFLYISHQMIEVGCSLKGIQWLIHIFSPYVIYLFMLYTIYMIYDYHIQKLGSVWQRFMWLANVNKF